MRQCKRKVSKKANILGTLEQTSNFQHDNVSFYVHGGAQRQLGSGTLYYNRHLSSMNSVRQTPKFKTKNDDVSDDFHDLFAFIIFILCIILLYSHKSPILLRP